jgi:hypothetical protein
MSNIEKLIDETQNLCELKDITFYYRYENLFYTHFLQFRKENKCKILKITGYDLHHITTSIIMTKIISVVNSLCENK